MPVAVPPIDYFILTDVDELAIKNIAQNFPAIFDQAKLDWAKYQAAKQYDLVDPATEPYILDWFRSFPQFWETFRPNWIFTETGLVSPHRVEFANEVDAWIHKLEGNVPQSSLSVAFIVIAGVLIAVAAGIAGAIWAIGYVQEQANVSRMIDEIVAGNLPPEVLQQSIADNEPGVLDKITGIGSLALAGAALYIAAPFLKQLLSGRSR